MNDTHRTWRNRIRTWSSTIKREGVALWFAVRDPRTPFLPKLLCGFAVAYALSPIDLIPDFIPILGYVDDVLLLPGLMWLAIKAMPTDLMADFRRQADQWIQAGGARPRSRIGAVGIVLLWILAMGLAWLWWVS